MKIQKKNIFILGSAESHNVNKYKKDIDWWEEEKITLQDKENSLKNLKKYDFNVDYILTHNAPKLIGLILATQYANNYCNYNYKKSLEEILYKANDETARFLNEILYKIKAKESHFAHFHLDKIITKEDIENYQYYLNPFNEKQEDININYFECHYKNLPKKLL